MGFNVLFYSSKCSSFQDKHTQLTYKLFKTLAFTLMGIKKHVELRSDVMQLKDYV